MINREELLRRHHPILEKIEIDSPLTVGNGEFAFTADVTGMQSFYDHYHDAHMPLCTMAQWSWHTTPASKDRPYLTLEEDVEMTEYAYENRVIRLPVEKKKGSEATYDWLRQNPHRPDLARIALVANGKEIAPDQLSDIHQELHLYEGKLVSQFKIEGKTTTVTTLCHQTADVLGFTVETEHDDLQIRLHFPYGSHHPSGADWSKSKAHTTQLLFMAEDCHEFKWQRKMDDFTYFVTLIADQSLSTKEKNVHQIDFKPEKKRWSLSLSFDRFANSQKYDYAHVEASNQKNWPAFWKKVGMVDFSGSTDIRAQELERRVILSTYLLAIQSSGSLPPQETGLTCNSWHGKFHLEMHLWHSAWLPLWNQSELLEKSLPWYHDRLGVAIYNAKKNGFNGARWPKQVADDGIDSPSPISPLLIWQQSHIIYMLELLRQQKQSVKWLACHWELVKQSADFMCDFLSRNEESGCYELVAPLMPAQEEHDPTVVKNPTFELEYWRFCLQIAIKWAKILEQPWEAWEEIVQKMAPPPVGNGRYLAHENCPDTFEKFNRDHPSMLGAFGLINSERLNVELLVATMDKVLKCWEFETMWGWDFAMMAMTAVRIGKPELAMDILLMTTHKNDYVKSGNNYQRLRTDLPLYLPGNGSLLLAVALMTAGWKGCQQTLPGIPKDGNWQVKFENIHPFPY